MGSEDIERLKARRKSRFSRRPGGAGEGEDEQQPLRALVWYPRFGLGNSLRGFTSSVVYAFLSGRQFLRWHGGAHADVSAAGLRPQERTVQSRAWNFTGGIQPICHGLGMGTHQLVGSFHDPCACHPALLCAIIPSCGAKSLVYLLQVLDSLCYGFACGVDLLNFTGDIRHISGGLGLRTHQLIGSLHDPRPLMHTSSGCFFDFWQKTPAMTRCVLDAFQCADKWCVRSRALQLLLGAGPTPALAAALEDNLDVAAPVPLHEPLPTEPMATPQPTNNDITAATHTTSPSASSSRRRLSGVTPDEAGARTEDSAQWPGNSAKGPGDSPERAGDSAQRIEDSAGRVEDSAGRVEGSAGMVEDSAARARSRGSAAGLESASRAALESVSSAGQGSGSSAGRRLLESSGSEGGGGAEAAGEGGQMDKGAGLRLQFDVAIHIRTHSK